MKMRTLVDSRGLAGRSARIGTVRSKEVRIRMTVPSKSRTSTAQGTQVLASLLIACWQGAIIRGKSNPSLYLVDDFVPFALALLPLGKPKQGNQV
jgi:hypothetical protein